MTTRGLFLLLAVLLFSAAVNENKLSKRLKSIALHRAPKSDDDGAAEKVPCSVEGAGKCSTGEDYPSSLQASQLRENYDFATKDYSYHINGTLEVGEEIPEDSKVIVELVNCKVKNKVYPKLKQTDEEFTEKCSVVKDMSYPACSFLSEENLLQLDASKWESPPTECPIPTGSYTLKEMRFHFEAFRDQPKGKYLLIIKVVDKDEKVAFCHEIRIIKNN